MMAAFFTIGLLASVGLIWQVHGDPDHTVPLGAWAAKYHRRPIERVADHRRVQ